MIAIVDSKLLYYEEHHKKKPGVNLFDTLANYLKYVENLTGKPFKEVIMVYDIGKSSYRLDIWPSYKAKRSYHHLPEAFKSTYEVVIPKIAKNLGLSNFPIEGVEADDLAGILSHKLQDEVILISGDQDWCQLVLELGDRVRYFYVKKYQLLDLEGTIELTKCRTVPQFLVKKSATDDIGDNLRGITSIGKVKFQKWADVHFNNPDSELEKAFLEFCSGRGPHKDYEDFGITSCEQLYEFNMKLGAIMTDLSKLTIKQKTDVKACWTLRNTKEFNSELALELSRDFSEGDINPFGGSYELDPTTIEYFYKLFRSKDG